MGPPFAASAITFRWLLLSSNVRRFKITTADTFSYASRMLVQIQNSQRSPSALRRKAFCSPLADTLISRCDKLVCSGLVKFNVSWVTKSGLIPPTKENKRSEESKTCASPYMYMCAHIYMPVYVYKHTHTYVYMYVYIYIYVCVDRYIYIYIYMCTYIYASVCI